jgi:hypothetical protein
MKPHILEAGGFGFVSSEAEMDELITTIETEWKKADNATQDFYMITANKPKST